MNGFQFRVAISAAAPAASTCCSPARNNSSPPRQRSTQCCSLKQQSMWENIEERWCYTGRRLLSISIPAYCAGKRRPLWRNTAAENSETTGGMWLAGSAVNQSLKPFDWLVLLRAGPVVNDSSVAATVTRIELKFNIVNVVVSWGFLRSRCRTFRSIFLSFYDLKNANLRITLTSQMLMFRTKDAQAKLTLVDGSSFARLYRGKSSYPNVWQKDHVPVALQKNRAELSGSVSHVSKLFLDFNKRRAEKFQTTVSFPYRLMSNAAGRANPPPFLLLLFFFWRIEHGIM